MVTGADGFLGSRLADDLYKLCTVYRIGHSRLDITNRQEVADVVKELRPDFVLHCAALSDVGFCEEHPSLCEQVNVMGPLYLAEACKANAARLIFMSSDQIYHNSGEMAPNREEDAAAPTNVYGISKLRAEQELFSPKLAEGLPELCFSTLPGTGELICIKRGEIGYYHSDWNTNDPAHNRELADYNNERLGVTPAQEKAMKTGSMFGWGVPGADPAYYEQQPEMGRDDPLGKRILRVYLAKKRCTV